MADYIERQAAIDAFNRIKNTLKNPETAHYDTLMFYEIEDVLEDVEPADVVPVIRCRDCKYSHMTYDGKCKYCDIWFPDEDEYMDGDYFCASAEQR